MLGGAGSPAVPLSMHNISGEPWPFGILQPFAS